MSCTLRIFAWLRCKVAVRAAAMALALAVGCTAAMDTIAAQHDAVPADAVKAAFLFHFGSYVEWPADALASGDITIGVVGADPIVRELRNLLPGRTIENRQVHVRALTASSSLQNVHILYIGSDSTAVAAKLIDAAARRPILIITDAAEGMQRGSMINFVHEDRRVRFEISRGAAERAGLKLSSRLLSVALRIHRSGRPLERTPTGERVALVIPG